MCDGENVSKEKIERVVKDCEIESDIQGFAKRYDTLIGEKGIKLSGGQKQRIGMARGLIKQKPIMILDGTLSKIDHTTKNNILRHWKKYNRTTIWISNDLEIINYVDNIIYIDCGTTMVGSHKELLKRNHNYRKLMEIYNNVI